MLVVTAAMAPPDEDEEPQPAPPCRQISAGYLLIFGGFGVIYPFLPLFLYKHAALTKAQIGVFTAVQQAVRSGATPALGAFADARRRHRAVLLGCAVGSAMLLLLLLPAARAPRGVRFACLLGADTLAFLPAGFVARALLLFLLVPSLSGCWRRIARGRVAFLF